MSLSRFVRPVVTAGPDELVADVAPVLGDLSEGFEASADSMDSR